MNRLALFAVLAPTLLMAGSPPRSSDSGEIQSVVVTNFPETQQVAGTVSVARPIPSTRLLTTKALVAPGGPADLDDLTDAGAIDVSGFAFATLSLAVTVQGTLAAPGKVGVLLVPDQPEVLAALRTPGVLQFSLSVEAPVAPSASGIHQSTPSTVRLAFPRYRVFFYNTTPRTSEATLYTYVGNS
ncbi:MAG TPA: hypothetical protein VGV61_16125 [Thermoanaerobaculia bacterium]|jgi:hypothetical protein|nr:hypothetical protein [Thermoanaerobaculia bacterium]